MTHLFSLLKHELKLLLITPSTYIASVLFLLLESFVFLFILTLFSHTPQAVTPAIYFYESFWLPVFFVVPLITMRSIAEEMRQGTLEALMTTPVSSFEVALSKFLSSYIFYLFLWSLTISFPYLTLWIIKSPQYSPMIIDSHELIGTFLFIGITGTLYIAIGILCSSLTRSQLVSGMLTFCLLLIIIIGPELLNYAPFFEIKYLNWLKIPFEQFQSFDLLSDFNRGVIDSRPFFLYISTAILALGITSIIIKSKA